MTEMPSGSYRGCLEKMHDSFLEAVKRHDSQSDWPDICHDRLDDKKTVKELAQELRTQRLAYPVWIVAPYESRVLMKTILPETEPTMHSLKEQPREKPMGRPAAHKTAT